MSYSSAMRYAVMNTPLGSLTITSTEKGLASVQFGGAIPINGVSNPSGNQPYIRQLEEYFAGSRTKFDLSLDVTGTPFQLMVWHELLGIPYGETRSYGEIARSIGKPGAARAVGMANHDNPIAVVIPCHRVVGHNGALTGYAGGLHLKQKLLSLEQHTRTLFT
jgi:O-6-methylguanine DNA methyltransferase